MKETELVNKQNISNLARNFDLKKKLVSIAVKAELKAKEVKNVKLEIHGLSYSLGKKEEQNNQETKIENAYIVYDLEDWSKIPLNNFTLKSDCLVQLIQLKIVIKVSGRSMAMKQQKEKL